MSTIKVVGLNSMSKSGAKRSGFPRFANVNYIFRIFEECYEFKEKDKQAVVEAVRHIGEPAKYLDIFICNPWVESNWFVKYCTKMCKHDEKLLKSVGSQYHMHLVDDRETGLSKKILLHYTN